MRVGAIYETYGFDDGYPVEDITQLTVPIAIHAPLGSRAALVVSAGYVSVELDSRDAGASDQRLHGPLDTEARLDLSVVPDRLMAFVSTTIPTGRQTLVDDQLSLSVALANDAIGFSASSLGGGGSMTAGLSAAVPLGRMALGGAATAGYSFPFEPALAERVSLSPGAEVRLRVGLEGPLARRTYLRLAASVAARGRDRLDGVPTHGLGRRQIGYVTVEQGVGSFLVSVYAFDVYRGSPQLEPTALGVAVLPKGNLLAVGGSLATSLGATMSLSANLEYRVAAAATSNATDALERQASSLRAGAEVRRRLGAATFLVVRAQGAFGEALQGATYYDFRGYRVGASLELAP